MKLTAIVATVFVSGMKKGSQNRKEFRKAV